MALSSRYVFWSTAAFLFVGLLALLSIVVANLWLNERAQVAFEQVIAARDIRATTADIRSAVQIGESGQRGFILTGNEIYLAPYSTAKVQAQRQLETLRQMLAAIPEMQNMTARLATLVGDKFEEMDQTIALKRMRSDAEAMAMVRTNRGKALVDEANVFFTAIIQQADQRLTEGVEEQRANAGMLRTVSAIGALIIIAVVGGAAYLLYRYTSELREARDEVNESNAALETRVATRTADLVEARDRATLLLSEVNHRVANSLAMVSSLVALQSRSLTDEAAKKALAETQDRIFAVSLVHKRLYSGNDVSGVTLDEYLTGLLEHLKTSLRSAGQGATLTYDIEPVRLATDASINLGVVVTEWVTNAFKYAYPDKSGEIRVRLRGLDGGDVELTVEDDGVGRVEGAPTVGTGLGTRIVTAMAHSMQAAVSYDRLEPGTRARLVFSPRRDAQAAQ
jgi:two-component sensor histidine kinase/CHASE3 domain sensor protein